MLVFVHCEHSLCFCTNPNLTGVYSVLNCSVTKGLTLLPIDWTRVTQVYNVEGLELKFVQCHPPC